jgi:hypothetical protein
VAFFGGPAPEISVWRRFRDTTDAFAVLRNGALTGARAIGNAEAMVELFLEMVPEFPNIFSLTVDDWRGGAVWHADSVTQAAFLDAFYALRIPVSGAGGVEFTLASEGEQLSLSSHLEVVAWAPTDRWLYLMERAGLREKSQLRGRLWRPARGAFPAAPSLASGLDAFVAALVLQPA